MFDVTFNVVENEPPVPGNAVFGGHPGSPNYIEIIDIYLADAELFNDVVGKHFVCKRVNDTDLYQVLSEDVRQRIRKQIERSL